jgi:hypothetical protein
MGCGVVWCGCCIWHVRVWFVLDCCCVLRVACCMLRVACVLRVCACCVAYTWIRRQQFFLNSFTSCAAWGLIVWFANPSYGRHKYPWWCFLMSHHCLFIFICTLGNICSTHICSSSKKGIIHYITSQNHMSKPYNHMCCCFMNVYCCFMHLTQL